MSPQAAPWIASRSLSSGACARDPLARNDDVEAVGATNQPDGQIIEIGQALSPKYSAFRVGQISALSPRVSRQTRGARDRHERAGDAVDAKLRLTSAL